MPQFVTARATLCTTQLNNMQRSHSKPHRPPKPLWVVAPAAQRTAAACIFVWAHATARLKDTMALTSNRNICFTQEVTHNTWTIVDLTTLTVLWSQVTPLQSIRNEFLELIFYGSFQSNWFSRNDFLELIFSDNLQSNWFYRNDFLKMIF